MSTTTANHDQDVHYWATLLRTKLAEAPAGPIVTRAKQEANKAREAGTLSVPFLRLLVRELDDLAARPASKPRLPKPFSNKRAQACERCAEWIKAGEGLCERSEDDTRWIVSHKEGQCPVILFEGVPEGRYAIDWAADGAAEDIKFYQIKSAVLYAQASDELWPIKDTEHVAKVLEAVKADPKAASILYGIKLEHCGICGRALTVGESRELGIGPICREKMGW